jgi:hypothetical protein
MASLTPYAERLLRAMTGPPPDDDRFRGEPPDLSRVADDELGELFAVAWARQSGADWATPGGHTCLCVLGAAREHQVRFSPDACAVLFRALAGRAAGGGSRPWSADAAQTVAAGALLRCAGPWPGDLAGPAAALARQEPKETLNARLALAALAGAEVEAEAVEQARARLAGDPLALDELDLAVALDAGDRAAVAEATRGALPRSLAPLPDAIDRLAAVPGYAALARAVMEAADGRVADIHAGRVPYRSDRAFTVTETDVLWRACQVALIRDEPWTGELLSRLLPGVAVAPTAARTAPSQSACSALAQAVEAWPTPEAVAALRQGARVARHAGVKKKLDVAVRRAERGLARRPDLALRLPAAAAPTRAQVGTAVRALEGGFVLGTAHRFDRWLAELALHPHLGGVVRRLVWEVEIVPGRWRSVLPGLGPDGSPAALAGETGTPVAPPPADTTVRLWHPARADGALRDAWRDRLVELRLAQPFRQAFREHYRADDDRASSTDQFAGHVVSLRPLLGLALRQGWLTSHPDGVLRRELGAWRTVLAVAGSLFPGAAGRGETGAVALERRAGGRWEPAAFGEAGEVVVSEALRGVDLLVSAAGFGVEDDPEARRDPRRQALLARLADRPLGEMARTRRAALERVLGDLVDEGRVVLGERHVRVGAYAVHLATGRVTRDGEPVALDVPALPAAVALPWLPYDEQLLNRIARTVVALAEPARTGGGRC